MKVEFRRDENLTNDYLEEVFVNGQYVGDLFLYQEEGQLHTFFPEGGQPVERWEISEKEMKAEVEELLAQFFGDDETEVEAEVEEKRSMAMNLQYFAEKSLSSSMVLDSREVAEMIGKRHSDLIRDIDRYINVVDQNAKLRSDNFFVESSYQSGTGKNYKCYLLTKQGCEMVANKLTGEKGINFTAEYVSRFNEMEQQSKLGTPNMDGLSESTKALLLATQSIAQIEQSMAKTNKRIDKLEEDQEGIRKIATFDADDDWRKKTNRMINSIIVNHYNKDFNAAKDLRAKIYADVEKRAHVKLSIRLTNKQSRMALQGASKTKVDAVNKLDVIADDPKLIEVYVAVVRKYAMYYGG
ncbi:Rha family transcriptional regulator [Ligilactobacillus equi]|uniref:Phage antirepressor n=1 Tax=Ligilactobacillus equi DPC 6820 TaxID=1392007 RepID=V7HVE9_9LACO|nr:Rha family transcriptional regulator [Ligilactobacillus equi]ETA73245.1 phage antirepressor [Ligilactobacillus equi DPC 6820]